MNRDELIETMARGMAGANYDLDGEERLSWVAYTHEARGALTAIEAAGMRVVPERTPVAWRVKDFADGWILFTDEHEASRHVIETGALMQALIPQEDSTSE